jgi:hypothetical protein
MMIIGGIISGLALMPVFLNDKIMGGYASFRRRFARLSHIAFVVLGIINILSGMMATADNLPLLIGGVGMATGCLISAFWEKFKYVLVIFAVLVLWGCIQMVQLTWPAA